MLNDMEEKCRYLPENSEKIDSLGIEILPCSVAGNCPYGIGRIVEIYKEKIGVCPSSGLIKKTVQPVNESNVINFAEIKHTDSIMPNRVRRPF